MSRLTLEEGLSGASTATLRTPIGQKEKHKTIPRTADNPDRGSRLTHRQWGVGSPTTKTPACGGKTNIFAESPVALGSRRTPKLQLLGRGDGRFDSAMAKTLGIQERGDVRKARKGWRPSRYDAPVTWYYKSKEFSNIPPCLAGFERKKIILDMIKGFEVADVFNQYPGIHEVLDKGLTRKGETFYEWGVRKELQALTTLGAYLSDMFGAGPALEHSAAQALSYRQHYIVPYLWKIVRAALDKAEGLDALKLQFLKTFKTHPKLKEYLDKPDGEIPGGQYALKNGYQPLLQKIIAKDKTEVRLSCPVTDLEWGEAKEEVGGGKKKQTKKKIGWLVTTTMVESEGEGEDEKKSELRNKQNDGGDDNEAKNGSDKDSNAAAATTGTPTTTTTATTTATTTTEAFDCVIVCGLGKFDFLPPKHPAKELLSMMKVNPGLETWLVELESWDEERFGKTNSIVFGERTTNFGTRKGLPYDSRPYALSKDYADSNIVGCIAYPDDKLNKEEKEKLMREELKLELGASVKRVIGFRRFHWPVHVPPEAEKKDFFDKLHELQGQRQLYFVGEAFSSAGVQACIDWIEEFMPWHFPMHNIAPSAK
eukprot:jgi/Bigna1/76517/fgenesh1_pg.41_\